MTPLSLEAATYRMAWLHDHGYPEAKLQRVPCPRDQYGQPLDYEQSLQFTVEPGPLYTPARWRPRKRKEE